MYIEALDELMEQPYFRTGHILATDMFWGRGFKTFFALNDQLTHFLSG
jgi:hypothetical protein